MIIVEYVNNKNYNPCGSDTTQIFKNGKTLRIAINNMREKNYFRSDDIIKANIYIVQNIYKRETYKLLKSVNLK